MKLKEWMKEERYNNLTFAKKANLHPNTIVRAIHGRDILFSSIINIVKATNGKVTYKELAQELIEAEEIEEEAVS